MTASAIFPYINTLYAFLSQYKLILLLLLQVIPLCFAEEYDDVPLQDIRVIRDESLVDNNSFNSYITENPFLGRNDEEDFSWLDDTIKDIAYYLRSHKFNEFDRRYEIKTENAPREYYGKFPKPSLKSLHWEVQEFCEPSFLSCMKYMKRKLKEVGLKRQDDTAVVMTEQNWTREENWQMIKEVDNECVKMREKDDKLADPFQGPIERFQWRTTASYYLCWYTMNEVPDLEHINEECDNFAYCFDYTYGERNRDYRANDEEPFACARYSFCPDPCCPAIRHTTNHIECDNNPWNPCFETNSEGRRNCKLVRSENTNFREIILNRWNVTCNCSDAGYRYSSRYGLCIDIDECGDNSHVCENKTEMCINLPGTHECACSWGYTFNVDENKCTESSALALIKKDRKEQEEEKKNRTMAKSLVKMLYAKLVALASSWDVALDRTKRWLVYPGGGQAKVVMGIAWPIPLGLKQKMSCSVNFQYEGPVPTNISQLHQYPPIIPSRSVDKRDTDDKSDNRMQAYLKMEEALESYGFKDGRSCLLRSICENAMDSVDHEANGILGTLLHIFLSPDYGDGEVDGELDAAYVDAQKAGYYGVDCLSLYPGCPYGNGVLDFVSAYL
ncbi:hypothetical protein Trydic_g19280 [Trypoxylus dichotomus]